jgi:predicted Ser/Thr protein kinase
MDPYKDVKVSKVLKRGGKSKYVYLLKNGLVKKAYKKNTLQKRRFKVEVKILEHLKECPFVPKVQYVDKDKRVFYMTHMGKTLKRDVKNNKRLREGLKKRLKELKNDWNLLRHKNGQPMNRIYHGNVTEKGGQINIIDFGSPECYKIIGKSKTLQEVTTKNK